MRPPGTAQQLERRRRQAIRLLQAGKNLSAVARAVSASVSSVFRWSQAYRRKGVPGLHPQPTPGRPPKLSTAQKKRLVTLLLKGSLSAGYRTDLWTLTRVAAMIRRHFGVAYHPCHVWKLLVSRGWSCQKPERRALQRDEAAIAHWKRYRWPHIKKRTKMWSPSGLPG
ncbi:MAG: IS630 family transposase [Nitrospirae bacterium]|nr:MAG: IS630 family transposase [Nitrospirota bacterium]